MTGPASDPVIGDLYCGEGGASAGYVKAGFRVFGVDKIDQPNYPWDFCRDDALVAMQDLAPHVHAWHASPPCNDHSNLAALPTTPDHATGHLLAATIAALRAQSRPWVVENVVSRSTRAAMPGAVLACGRAFGIPELKRHRLFLASFPLTMPPCACTPGARTLGVYGDLRPNERQGRNERGRRASIGQARAMFGTPWMSPRGLSQALPDVYTEHVGRQLMAHLSGAAVAR